MSNEPNKQTFDVSKDVLLELIANERRTYVNTIALLQIRYRVNKRIQNPEALKAIEKELEQLETSLDELDKIAKEQ